MLKKPKAKQKTVAEKVAELITHPNQSGSDNESENEATAPRVEDFDDDEYQMPDAGTTEFRKKNVKLLSEQSKKYKGKIASRKDFEEEEDSEEEDGDSVDDDDEYEQSDEEDDNGEDIQGNNSDEENTSDSDEENTSDSDVNEEDFKSFSNILKKAQNGTVKHEESDDDDEESKNDSDIDDEEDDSGEEEDDDAEEDDGDDETEETEVISKVNHEAEIQKGISVQNQLRLWERLLELRINSQKFLSKCNQLPAGTAIKELEITNDKHKTVLRETCTKTQHLLCQLLTLQNSLYCQYPEINKSMKGCLKRPMPFKGDHENDEPPLKQINTYLDNRFDTFKPYRNAVLLKWDDRTKLLTPGAGAKKKSMDDDYDIIKKINNVLMNKSMLVEKSQQMKSNQGGKRNLTENQMDEGGILSNCNIYDDTEFYHQQLRELIEYKANTSGNMSEVTKQYLELQKLRQKMKKKVDTRASKGRKLRYVVHNKLINFMAPQDISTWTDESKEELCKSLFV